ncbi:MAG: class I SAM-dependent methyltransferase [Bacteroidales bacterium]|nr:class I SAM-dependent methyltransferase [Bacteroidales bacterium]
MNNSFKYKNIDLEGMETLHLMAEADRFNHWIYHTIKPFCSGKILEIGSGIGNISNYFIDNNQDITLSDIRQNYVNLLQNKHQEKASLRDVIILDIIDPNFDTKFAKYFGSFDSVYALNIVEHVKDDKQAIANIKKLLKPNGTVVVLVPAYQKLYNLFDKELEHYRRYNMKTLDQLLIDNKLIVIHHQYFNFIGVFGWWFNGSLLKKKTIPSAQMRLYNALVPIIKLIDKMIINKMGLSVVSVGENN